jgi:hypothetical protein
MLAPNPHYPPPGVDGFPPAYPGQFQGGQPFQAPRPLQGQGLPAVNPEAPDNPEAPVRVIDIGQVGVGIDALSPLSPIHLQHLAMQHRHQKEMEEQRIQAHQINLRLAGPSAIMGHQIGHGMMQQEQQQQQAEPRWYRSHKFCRAMTCIITIVILIIIGAAAGSSN